MEKQGHWLSSVGIRKLENETHKVINCQKETLKAFSFLIMGTILEHGIEMILWNLMDK